MNSNLRTILERLEKRNQLEHSQDDIPDREKICVITSDTGCFYNLILKLIDAKKILEIGTSVGYSTLWFADALNIDNGDCKIITIEWNHDKIVQAARNFAEAGLADYIEIKEGTAKSILADLR